MRYLQRLLKTFLFGCWDRSTLWLTAKAVAHKFSSLLTRVIIAVSVAWWYLSGWQCLTLWIIISSEKASRLVPYEVMFLSSKDHRQSTRSTVILAAHRWVIACLFIVCNIGVDPATVRGSGPSWNFASEGPPLFGPSQNVWSTVMKHSEHNLCQYQWLMNDYVTCHIDATRRDFGL